MPGVARTCSPCLVGKDPSDGTGHAASGNSVGALSWRYASASAIARLTVTRRRALGAGLAGLALIPSQRVFGNGKVRTNLRMLVRWSIITCRVSLSIARNTIPLSRLPVRLAISALPLDEFACMSNLTVDARQISVPVLRYHQPPILRLYLVILGGELVRTIGINP